MRDIKDFAKTPSPQRENIFEIQKTQALFSFTSWLKDFKKSLDSKDLGAKY